MKRRVESWTLEDLHKARNGISFPEYQRQANLWPLEKRRLLIDSILRDFDIPKLYFNETENSFEVVDGQQRLWAIWEYVDNEYAIDSLGKTRYYRELPTAERKRIRNYELQVTIFEDAENADLRELFLRLQMGLLLVTGEKLHARTGAMKDFVFERLKRHEFVAALKMPNRRYSKETWGAQVSVNSFARAKSGLFARTRYEDLLHFFQEYERPLGSDREFFIRQSKAIVATLDKLWECFGTRSSELSSRSYTLSVYLVFEELCQGFTSKKAMGEFREFVFALWKRLRDEIGAGIERTNKELYAFETMLSSAPGERYQIERRHQKLLEYFEYFKERGKIKGD